VDDPVERVRAICLALPETNERLSHGSPSWFIRDKKQFASLDDHHHGVDRIAIWCPAPPGVQEEVVAAEPDRFFRPPYVGGHGWIGVRIDEVDGGGPDWDELAAILLDAYCKVAPAALVAQVRPPSA
jgi:hypothetical protein